MNGTFAAALATFLLQAAPNPAAKMTPAWRVDWNDDTCSVVLGSSDPATSLSLNVPPGAERTMILAVNPAWKRSPTHRPSRVRLKLDAREERPASVYFLGKEIADDPTLLLAASGRSFLGRLSTAKSLSVAEGERLIATAELQFARELVDAIRQCEQDALLHWGVDPIAWAALRSGPIPTAAIESLVRSDDYPDEAVRSKLSGKVVVRLSVDAQGTPTSCDLAVKSGSDALDARSCSVFLGRARFKPAVSAQGIAVAAPYIAKITWSLSK